MAGSAANPKVELRAKIHVALGRLSPERRAADSLRVCELLRRRPLWQSAASVLFFAPMADEPDVWPLVAAALAEGKVVALPRFEPGTNRYVAHQILELPDDVVSGQFGIREPKNSCPVRPLNRLDLVLVPGVAFDLHGRRLGRGKGFYDQLLAGVRGKTCGVAFDEQIVPAIPVEPHDVFVNCILTPTRWIEV
jgi:5-formyltetrahydrofolate cyclo-ligase